MFLGYNTNGLAHHDLFDAVELLAGIGFSGVAVTIDHNALSPRDPRSPDHRKRLRRLLDKLAMRSAVETGARFLLDPRVKHEPTLISATSAGRRRRIDFYKYAVDCAAELGSDCVSLWSGAMQSSRRDPTAVRNAGIKSNPRDCQTDGTRSVPATQEAMARLVSGLREVLDYAAGRNVAVAFEPEPGMLIDSMRAFEELLTTIDAPDLRLTLDVGHLHCQGETPIADAVRRWAPRLANVHIEDMCAGEHEHLMFGEGEIDFPPIFRALREIGYAGGVYVELSRHSHEGPTATRRAFEFLRNAMTNDEL